MRKLLLPAGLVLLLCAVLAGMCWQQFRHFLNTPLDTPAAGLTLVVEPGDSVRSVVQRLAEQGVTRGDWRWRLLHRLQPVVIKAGEYALTPGMTPPALLDLLASGKVVTYRFTIIEGWTFRQLVGALAENPILGKTTDVASLPGAIVGLPEGNPEGWFLPETYVFERGDSDIDILQRAYAAMRKALGEAWDGRDMGLPYETPYELLTMASIIEKETSREDERASIAGVFVRRLLNKWRLETDPTVIYGLGETYAGDIRRSDLKKDTAYNTYTRHGLPPTPISLPGVASLQAAAHPADGEVMFFVADGQGGHNFSVTLEEHNAAVRAMLKHNARQSGSKE